MHTHILQENLLKSCDGNGTSKLNIGVLVACLEMWQIHGCTQSHLCDVLPSLAPMFSATDSELHVHHSNRYCSYLCLHPIQQQWFIWAIHGDKLSDAIRQNHWHPLCFVTALEAHEESREGCKVWIWVSWLFSGTGWTCTYAFFCFVDFCLTLTWIYIIYILP